MYKFRVLLVAPISELKLSYIYKVIWMIVQYNTGKGCIIQISIFEYLYLKH